MKRCAFEVYIETRLGPTLSGGDVVIMDNLSPRKGPRVPMITQDRGTRPPFLPAYAPDFNPIEQVIGNICDLFTPGKCWNFFRHDGHAAEFT